MKAVGIFYTLSLGQNSQIFKTFSLERKDWRKFIYEDKSTKLDFKSTVECGSVCLSEKCDLFSYLDQKTCYVGNFNNGIPMPLQFSTEIDSVYINWGKIYIKRDDEINILPDLIKQS